MNRRQFLIRAGLATGATAIGGYATWKFTLHHTEVVHVTIPIAGLPTTLEGAKLVQLSDLHVGPDVDDDYVMRTFETANALKPDILAFTGDFVSWRGPQQLAQLERVMQASPSASIAKIAVLGNHDYGYSWREQQVADDIVKLVSNHGVDVIRNDARTIEGLSIIGVDDLWAGMNSVKRAREAASPSLPQLVLCHNPDGADLPEWEGYRGWMLSGHTHGGTMQTTVSGAAYSADSQQALRGRAGSNGRWPYGLHQSRRGAYVADSVQRETGDYGAHAGARLEIYSIARGGRGVRGEPRRVSIGERPTRSYSYCTSGSRGRRGGAEKQRCGEPLLKIFSASIRVFPFVSVYFRVCCRSSPRISASSASSA